MCFFKINVSRQSHIPILSCKSLLWPVFLTLTTHRAYRKCSIILWKVWGPNLRNIKIYIQWAFTWCYRDWKYIWRFCDHLTILSCEKTIQLFMKEYVCVINGLYYEQNSNINSKYYHKKLATPSTRICLWKYLN